MYSTVQFIYHFTRNPMLERVDKDDRIFTQRVAPGSLFLRLNARGAECDVKFSKRQLYPFIAPAIIARPDFFSIAPRLQVPLTEHVIVPEDVPAVDTNAYDRSYIDEDGGAPILPQIEQAYVISTNVVKRDVAKTTAKTANFSCREKRMRVVTRVNDSVNDEMDDRAATDDAMDAAATTGNIVPPQSVPRSACSLTSCRRSVQPTVTMTITPFANGGVGDITSTAVVAQPMSESDDQQPIFGSGGVTSLGAVARLMSDDEALIEPKTGVTVDEAIGLEITSLPNWTDENYDYVLNTMRSNREILQRMGFSGFFDRAKLTEIVLQMAVDKHYELPISPDEFLAHLDTLMRAQENKEAMEALQARRVSEE